ncbi:MAG TPA: DUF58 domain-containing protein [Alphaproteobacteria bacterium]|nr:DUF58 domain-containing protein [Alphaproteobacteria bacterium]
MARLLFDTDFLKKLEQLRLTSHRIYHGQGRGEHSTVKIGTSLEFSDYRNYQIGDDYRYIDWNIFSRLDRLFLKVFTAEEDLSIHILLDTSQSMLYGDPPKIEYAKRVAAALGYIGLSNLDRVGITTFGAGLHESTQPRRGRDHFLGLLEYCDRITCIGATDFNRSLMEYSFRSRRAGLAIVISDLLDPQGFERGLEALRFARYDVLLLQILDEEEVRPSYTGPVRLRDLETDHEQRLTIDEILLARYRERVQQWCRRIEEFCLKSQIEYLRASTLIPFEDLILKYLRHGIHLQ